MTGQDAAHTAKVFADALPLTGIILTKTEIFNALRHSPHAWHFIHQGFHTTHLFHLQELVTKLCLWLIQ
jgi:hypothetical protein